MQMNPSSGFDGLGLRVCGVWEVFRVSTFRTRRQIVDGARGGVQGFG